MAIKAKDRFKLKYALRKILDVFEVYEEIAEGFTSWRSRPWSLARLGKKGIILDLGSGSCVNGIYAYKFNGTYLLCLDLSYKMSFLSRKALAKEKILGDSIAGDMLFLPLKDNSVDTILAIASIHHIPKEFIYVVLKEVARVAVNGAIFLVTIWSWRQPKFVIPTVFNLILKLIGLTRSSREYRIPWRKRGRTVYRYYHLYTLNELFKLFREYGFHVLSCGYTGYLKKKSDNLYVVARILKSNVKL